MLVVVRALCSSQVEWHSQPADLVLINSIHCSSVNARPAILDMGPPQPLDIKQGRTDRTGQDRTEQNKTTRKGSTVSAQLSIDLRK